MSARRHHDPVAAQIELIGGSADTGAHVRSRRLCEVAVHLPTQPLSVPERLAAGETGHALGNRRQATMAVKTIQQLQRFQALDVAETADAVDRVRPWTTARDVQDGGEECLGTVTHQTLSPRLLLPPSAQAPARARRDPEEARDRDP